MRTLLAMCTLVGAILGSGAVRAAAPADGLVCSLQHERVGQADAGFLDVSSDPPAHIVVDEADTGRVTPQARLELKAGHHKLTLVTLDGARKRTMGFTIEAGQTTKLAIHLWS
jgi:hypothetical protein